MLDRVKAFGEAAKDIIIYILTPLAFIAGYIFYLTQKNEDIREQLLAKDGEEKLNELQEKQKDVDSSANAAISNYEKLRSGYLRERDQSVRPGGTGGTETGGSQGSGTKPGGSDATNPDKGIGKP